MYANANTVRKCRCPSTGDPPAASGNQAFTKLLDSLWIADIGRSLLAQRRRVDDWQSHDVDEHRTILAVLAAGDGERAAKLMRAHVGDVRGSSMQERSAEDAMADKRATDEYIRAVAGRGTSTADEPAKLAALRDSGLLTEDEYRQQKAKLLG